MDNSEKQGMQMEGSAPPPAYSGPYDQQGQNQPGYPPAYQQSGYGQPVPTSQYQQPYAQQPYGQQFGQTPQSTVVVSQPGYTVAAPVVQLAPPNHAALAWLTCLFCFWPLGLAAIIKSNEVDSAMRVGDVNRATQASKNSRQYSMISIALGIICYIVVVVVIVLRVVLATSTNYYRY